MQLTSAQNAVVKAYVDGDSGLTALRTAGNYDGVAGALNALASPAFVVRKYRVETPEIGPTLNYVAVSNLTTANRDRATTFITLNPVAFSPTADVESYWDTTFGGALGGQGQATRDALLALWRRSATVCEKILATGTGTSGSPATLGTGADGQPTEGSISVQQLVPLWS